MNEYNVSFYAPDDGGFAIDVHNSTGTSPLAKFESLAAVRDFFSSLGISQDRLREIEAIYSGLTPGHVYHEKMFLPDRVIEALEKFTAETGQVADVPVRPNGSAHPANTQRV